MNKLEPCRLCQGLNTILIYKNSKAREFYKCMSCDYTQVHSQNFVSREEEIQRYLLHKNDVESEGYQNFLKPVVDQVLSHQKATDQGLDYGSGPSSVVIHLLKKQNYLIESYDPLFHQDKKVLDQKYDYLVCTEVVEHFQKPIQEFEKMLFLLKPQSKIYLKTGLTDFVKDFPRWHYHRDSTHVGFFSQKSLGFLFKRLGLILVLRESEFYIVSF